MQRQLPRPSVVDVDRLVENASNASGTPEGAIAKEMALLITNDAFKYPHPETKVIGSSRPLEVFDDDTLNRARLEIALEMPSDGREERQRYFEQAWTEVHDSSPLPGLASYADSEDERQQLLIRAFDVSLCIFSLFKVFTNTPSLEVSPNLSSRRRANGQQPREETRSPLRWLPATGQDAAAENRRGSRSAGAGAHQARRVPHAADCGGGGASETTGALGRGGEVCEE